MISVLINGDDVEVASGTTVEALVANMALTGKRIAIEINETIVPKSTHTSTFLQEGDRVEIVHAIGGG